MSNDKQLTVVEQREVEFYGDFVMAVRASDGTVYVPIRPICELIGVNRQGQQERINRDPILSSVSQMVTITTSGGVTQPQGREMACLPLDYLNGWLFGINANRVKKEVRESVLRYQRECYRVLYEAFQTGELSTDDTFSDLLAQDTPSVQAYKMIMAMAKMARQQIVLESRLGEHGRAIAANTATLGELAQRMESMEAELGRDDRLLSASQALDIAQGVKQIALLLSKNSGQNAYGGVYGELHRRFEVPTYRAIPATRFGEAMNFLREWWEGLTDSGDVPF